MGMIQGMVEMHYGTKMIYWLSTCYKKNVVAQMSATMHCFSSPQSELLGKNDAMKCSTLYG